LSITRQLPRISPQRRVYRGGVKNQELEELRRIIEEIEKKRIGYVGIMVDSKS
jgi:hypothetical protein